MMFAVKLQGFGLWPVPFLKKGPYLSLLKHDLLQDAGYISVQHETFADR